MKVVKLRRSDIEWARQFVESKTVSAFAYIMKRNAEYGVDSMRIDPAEEYAVLRNTMSKFDIERMLRIQISVR